MKGFCVAPLQHESNTGISAQGQSPHLNWELSSGAPPVKSSVLTLPWLASRRAMQRSAVCRSIISFLRGELSTWQWEHAWLQYRPMFSCSVVAGSRLRGRTLCSCNVSTVLSSRHITKFLILIRSVHEILNSVDEGQKGRLSSRAGYSHHMSLPSVRPGGCCSLAMSLLKERR